MPSHTEPIPSDVAATSRFSTAAAELWISMVRKKSRADSLSTWKRSDPCRISSPVFATATTSGALEDAARGHPQQNRGGAGKIARLIAHQLGQVVLFPAAENDKPPRLLIVGRRGPVGSVEDRIQILVANFLFGEVPNAVSPVDGLERFVHGLSDRVAWQISPLGRFCSPVNQVAGPYAPKERGSAAVGQRKPAPTARRRVKSRSQQARAVWVSGTRS